MQFDIFVSYQCSRCEFLLTGPMTCLKNIAQLKICSTADGGSFCERELLLIWDGEVMLIYDDMLICS